MRHNQITNLRLTIYIPMENSTTSMEYCTILLQNNIPQSSHALFTSAVHIMQHTSSLKRIRIFNAQK